MKTPTIKAVAMSLCLATCLTPSATLVAVSVSQEAEANSLRKLGNKFKRDMGKTGKALGIKQNKNRKGSLGGSILTGVVVGGVVGLATDSVAAGILTGVVVAGASEAFKNDLYKSHGNDMAWSGSTTSNRRNIVASPGRTVSDAERRATNARIKEDVKDVQRALAALGLYRKGIDGDFGPGSRAAVKEFQRSLGEPETGYLTAEQRHRLFIQAEQAGYTRTAVLNQIDESQAVRIPVAAAGAAAVAATTTPAIAEYRLAKSQFDSFGQEHLMAGELSAVSGASMEPDGSIVLATQDASGNASDELTGRITQLEAKPHDLSDQWVRVTFQPEGDATPVVLNTRDDFTSPQEASEWLSKFNSRAKLIARLTGDDGVQPQQSGTVIADAGQPAAQDNLSKDNLSTGSIEQAQPSDGSASADEDGRIVVADAKPVAPAPQPVAAGGQQGNTLSGFDEEVAVCQQGMYLSFKFPDGDEPVSHYNIVTPNGTRLAHNGNSTSYVDGSCAVGEYQYSYVTIDKSNGQDWKHFKREGTFSIAGNAEACDIALNDPNGSAQVSCF